jgi:hypothetical protein
VAADHKVNSIHFLRDLFVHRVTRVADGDQNVNSARSQPLNLLSHRRHFILNYYFANTRDQVLKIFSRLEIIFSQTGIRQISNNFNGRLNTPFREKRLMNGYFMQNLLKPPHMQLTKEVIYCLKYTTYHCLWREISYYTNFFAANIQDNRRSQFS